MLNKRVMKFLARVLTTCFTLSLALAGCGGEPFEVKQLKQKTDEETGERERLLSPTNCQHTQLDHVKSACNLGQIGRLTERNEWEVISETTDYLSSDQSTVINFSYIIDRKNEKVIVKLTHRNYKESRNKDTLLRFEASFKGMKKDLLNYQKDPIKNNLPVLDLNEVGNTGLAKVELTCLDIPKCESPLVLAVYENKYSNGETYLDSKTFQIDSREAPLNPKKKKKVSDVLAEGSDPIHDLTNPENVGLIEGLGYINFPKPNPGFCSGFSVKVKECPKYIYNSRYRDQFKIPWHTKRERVPVVEPSTEKPFRFSEYIKVIREKQKIGAPSENSEDPPASTEPPRESELEEEEPLNPPPEEELLVPVDPKKNEEIEEIEGEGNDPIEADPREQWPPIPMERPADLENEVNRYEENQCDKFLEDVKSFDLHQSKGLYWGKNGKLTSSEAMAEEFLGGILRSGRKERQYGSGLLTGALKYAACIMSLVHPGFNVSIGNMSARKGGKLGQHSSHRNGLDADVYFPMKSENPVPNTLEHGEAQQLEAMMTYIGSLYKTGELTRLFLDKKIKRKLCKIAKKATRSISQRDRVLVKCSAKSTTYKWSP